jgi:hypothetical protein
VLPGNVSIGGNLTVNGDQLRIGAASPFVRLFKKSLLVGQLSTNIQADGITRDDLTNKAYLLGMNVSADGPDLFRENAAGNGMDTALVSAIFTDYTSHTHTGTTTEDTIYSKVIRGGTIGANGALKLKLNFVPTVQGATLGSWRVKLGGTILASGSISTAHTNTIEGHIFNQNAQNAQNAWLVFTDLAAGTLALSQNTFAIDTSVDQTLTVTFQNGTSTDSQRFDFINVELANSFGPV